MRHARPDYQGRIIDVQNRIPRDEPVFLLRATDEFAPELVTLWAERLVARGGDPRMARMAFDQANAMRAWQRAHGSKVPDLPDHVLETKAAEAPEGRTVYGE